MREAGDGSGLTCYGHLIVFPLHSVWMQDKVDILIPEHLPKRVP
jgi:hypothetical protein